MARSYAKIHSKLSKIFINIFTIDNIVCKIKFINNIYNSDNTPNTFLNQLKYLLLFNNDNHNGICQIKIKSINIYNIIYNGMITPQNQIVLHIIFYNHIIYQMFLIVFIMLHYNQTKSILRIINMHCLIESEKLLYYIFKSIKY